MELTGTDTTPTQTPQKNGVMSPLPTQPSTPNSPPVDSPEAPASPTTRTREDASAAYRLASESDLEGVCRTASDNALFGVNQDWVHQNPGTHLDGGIDEDGKCKLR